MERGCPYLYTDSKFRVIWPSVLIIQGGLQQPPLRKICSGKTLRRTRVNGACLLQMGRNNDSNFITASLTSLVSVTWHHCTRLTLTPTPPFSFLDYLLGKGGVQKWGFPAWVSSRGPPAPNALCTHGTPPGCRCPGSDFVPIWDPLLWRNRT